MNLFWRVLLRFLLASILLVVVVFFSGLFIAPAMCAAPTLSCDAANSFLIMIPVVLIFFFWTRYWWKRGKLSRGFGPLYWKGAGALLLGFLLADLFRFPIIALFEGWGVDLRKTTVVILARTVLWYSIPVYILSICFWAIFVTERSRAAEGQNEG